MRITAVGKFDVRCFATKRRILIEDVYVVPNIVRFLISVKALCRKGIVTVFAEKEVVFKKENRTVTSGELRNQLYVVVFEEEKQANVMQMDEALVWHRPFAHCLGEKLKCKREYTPSYQEIFL
jgi:hypothetical protein